jgi:hypothetical protein
MTASGRQQEKRRQEEWTIAGDINHEKSDNHRRIGGIRGGDGASGDRGRL